MLAANDAAGQVPIRPLRGHHRRHALKDIIAKHEVVKERGHGVADDQDAERVGTEQMRQLKGAPQRRVRGHQRWNLPKEQSEMTPPKQRVSQAGRWLDEKQGIQAIFTAFDDSAMYFGHAAWKWWQLRIGQPPSQPQNRRHTNRNS